MNFVQMTISEDQKDNPDWFSDANGTVRVPEFDANGIFTGIQDTGQLAKARLESLATIHGWPLHGIFMGQEIIERPHFILHVSEFPISVEAEPADGVTTQMDAALERFYKHENPTQVTFRRQSNEVIVDPQYASNLPGLDERVAFELRSGGGAMPNGLTADQLYYVVGVDEGNLRFTVSQTQDGPTETFNSDGTPPCWMSYEDEFGADIRMYWINVHMFNYRGGTGNNYVPEVDYTMRVNNRGPNSGQWWVD